MACCKCCCEGGSPAGVCCGSPESCCYQPSQCCEDNSPTYCCEEDETCCDGTCCPVGEKCCQDDSTSYCCPDNETCCGGICCPSGYICCNGICCAPDEFCCDGVCQAGPCDCDPPCDTDACESCIEVTEGVFECQPYCAEGETCCDGTCCAEGECCVFGACTACDCDPPCTSDSCEVCTEVSTGFYDCVSTCDSGECCVDGVCGPCPCDPVCTGCYECVDGDCVSTCQPDECCVDGVCQDGGNAVRCISIYRSRFQNDTKYCAREDVDELEVNIPAAYSFPLTVRITGSVDDDLKINGTLIEDNVYEYLSEGCNGGHCVGGGPSGYPITISSSPMTLTLVDNFGQGRTLDLTVCLDPDGEQNVNECPTVTYVSSVGENWTAGTAACCVSPNCAGDPPADSCRCNPLP